MNAARNFLIALCVGCILWFFLAAVGYLVVDR